MPPSVLRLFRASVVALRFLPLLALLLGPASWPAAANPFTIAAASDLVFCLDALNAEFRRQIPEAQLEVSTGSSGNFFAQIQRGAPFDVFLSADMNYPRRLAEAGQAVEDTLTLYAVGRIVLWSVKTNLVVTNGLSVLTNITVRKVAIASPEHAPYGRAARAALEKAKLWDALQPKLVLGDNIAQTAQFVQTGNADAGIVALSLVLAPKLKGQGVWWLIPEELHPRLEQGAVLTRHGKDHVMARQYLEFLRSKEARGILDQFGFRLPPER